MRSLIFQLFILFNLFNLFSLVCQANFEQEKATQKTLCQALVLTWSHEYLTTKIEHIKTRTQVPANQLTVATERLNRAIAVQMLAKRLREKSYSCDYPFASKAGISCIEEYQNYLATPPLLPDFVNSAEGSYVARQANEFCNDQWGTNPNLNGEKYFTVNRCLAIDELLANSTFDHNAVAELKLSYFSLTGDVNEISLMQLRVECSNQKGYCLELAPNTQCLNKPNAKLQLACIQKQQAASDLNLDIAEFYKQNLQPLILKIAEIDEYPKTLNDFIKGKLAETNLTNTCSEVSNFMVIRKTL